MTKVTRYRLPTPLEASRDTWRVHVPILADVEWQCKLHSAHLLGVATEAAPHPLICRENSLLV